MLLWEYNFLKCCGADNLQVSYFLNAQDARITGDQVVTPCHGANRQTSNHLSRPVRLPVSVR
jgi:hypothetical protein